MLYQHLTLNQNRPSRHCTKRFSQPLYKLIYSFPAQSYKLYASNNVWEMARASTLALALLGLTCLTAVQATGYQPPQCRAPPNPSYGGSYGSYHESYVLGTVVNYYCNKGYELHGRSWTVCIHGSHGPYWLYPPPICSREWTVLVMSCGTRLEPYAAQILDRKKAFEAASVCIHS